MEPGLWAELGASPDAIARLERFVGLVRQWTGRINLIAPSTLSTIWSRHVEDSARIVLGAPGRPRLWADLGSGGGFPGIVVAILLADRGSGTRVVLVESDQRKAALLEEALRRLDTPGEVIAARAESIAPLGADVVSARALAPLDRLCALAARHLAAGGRALFPKGGNWQAEVDGARRDWRFDLDVQPVPGHNAGVVLALENLKRAREERDR